MAVLSGTICLGRTAIVLTLASQLEGKARLITTGVCGFVKITARGVLAE